MQKKEGHKKKIQRKLMEIQIENYNLAMNCKRNIYRCKHGVVCFKFLYIFCDLLEYDFHRNILENQIKETFKKTYSYIYIFKKNLKFDNSHLLNKNLQEQ